MRKLLFGLSLSLASLLLTGCELDPSDWGSSDRYKEDFASHHKLKPGGRVMLEGFNGSVEVIGWDKDEVDISGTKNAAREEVMREIKIDVDAQEELVRIRAIRPVERGCNCGVKFVLKVPTKVILDTIQTSNGSVRVESVTGNVRLKTSNGSVKVWGVDGNLEANTSNASIEVGKFQGAADLHTSNGRIKADGVRGAFSARTSNSSIDADISALDEGRAVVLESSNGGISVTLDGLKGNELRAHTSNASINVRVPADVHADLRASTSNGSITSDLEMTTSQMSKTRVNGKLNGGGPLMELTTSNGSVRILKR